MHPSVLVGLTLILVSGVLAQWVAWRLGLPSILLLLAVGFGVGPWLGWVDPDRLFGEMLLPAVSMAVALILYEGGLTLRVAELKNVGGDLWRLILIGGAVSWLVSLLAGRWLLGLSWPLASLLGAVLIVTGPTVIAPLLRQMRPAGRIGPLLKWEGIVIDPIGAVAAVLIYEVIVASAAHGAASVVLGGALKTIVYGGGLGFVSAVLLTLVLNRYWVPDYLQNAVSLMLVLATFAISNQLQHESGLLAVTVMGFVLSNQRKADVQHIVAFKANLQVLLIAVLFIVLAARLAPADMMSLGIGGIAFVAILIFVGRPLSILASTIGSKLKRNEVALLAWMAPRGIVAAAVSSVFALRLEEHGFKGAEVLVPATFAAIVGTVAVYGLTAPFVAKRLGVADDDPQGLLIIGAHPFARQLAKLLSDRSFRVQLVDSNHENISAARMAGLQTFHGSALAERAEDELDLGGLGKLLALTPNDSINLLVVQHYAEVFGKANSYQFAPRKAYAKAHSFDKRHHGRLLFNESADFDHLNDCIRRGFTIKATPLTEEFGVAEFLQRYGGSLVPLFAITESKRIRLFTTDRSVAAEAGETIVALVEDPEGDSKPQLQPESTVDENSAEKTQPSI
ncbi:MAG: cation:proton antiporter [Phycisphaerae bacterium]|nr:cation:proton antiporter [Phycisphaerales bacterium]